MKKLLTILGAVGLSASATSLAVACSSSEGENNHVVLSANNALNSLEKGSSGTIEIFAKNPDGSDFTGDLTAVSSNPDILTASISERTLSVSAVEEGSATVKISESGGSNFDLDISVVPVATKVDLTNAIAVNNLGVIENYTNSTIKSQLIAANGAGVYGQDLEVENATSTGATVKVKTSSKHYKPGGSVAITYVSEAIWIDDYKDEITQNLDDALGAENATSPALFADGKALFDAIQAIQLPTGLTISLKSTDNDYSALPTQKDDESAADYNTRLEKFYADLFKAANTGVTLSVVPKTGYVLNTDAASITRTVKAKDGTLSLDDFHSALEAVVGAENGYANASDLQAHILAQDYSSYGVQIQGTPTVNADQTVTVSLTNLSAYQELTTAEGTYTTTSKYVDNDKAVSILGIEKAFKGAVANKEFKDATAAIKAAEAVASPNYTTHTVVNDESTSTITYTINVPDGYVVAGPTAQAVTFTATWSEPSSLTSLSDVSIPAPVAGEQISAYTKQIIASVTHEVNSASAIASGNIVVRRGLTLVSDGQLQYGDTVVVTAPTSSALLSGVRQLDVAKDDISAVKISQVQGTLVSTVKADIAKQINEINSAAAQDYTVLAKRGEVELKDTDTLAVGDVISLKSVFSSSYIRGSITQTVGKANLDSLAQVAGLNQSGISVDETKKAIKAEIKKIAPTAVETTDYNISIQRNKVDVTDNVLVGDIITVSAVAKSSENENGSLLLSGSWSTTVASRSLSNVKYAIKGADKKTIGTVKTEILAAINAQLSHVQAYIASDYAITFADAEGKAITTDTTVLGKGSTILVKPVADSTKLASTGQIRITLK